MSRALYHLSYGTAQAGRKPGALSGEDPILRFAPAPSACASSSVAWPAPLAFSCSSLLQKNEAEPSTYGSEVGSRWLRRLDSNQQPSVGRGPLPFCASRIIPLGILRSYLGRLASSVTRAESSPSTAYRGFPNIQADAATQIGIVVGA